MSRDNRDPLGEEPFSYQETKEGKVLLYFKGKLVETLKDRDADRFTSRIRNASSREAQLLMAKATKNFKRGNEQLSKTSPKK